MCRYLNSHASLATVYAIHDISQPLCVHYEMITPVPHTTFEIGGSNFQKRKRFSGFGAISFLWKSKNFQMCFEVTLNRSNTLIGLIFARLNFAISWIFAIFAKLKLAKTCEIVDSRDWNHAKFLKSHFGWRKQVETTHLFPKNAIYRCF